MERSRKNREQLGDMATNLQLYGATKEKTYLENFKKQIWDALELGLASNMQTALDAIPYMDDAYKKKLRPYVEKYNDYIHDFDKENPYGVPIGRGNWAGVNMVLNFGIAVNYAHLSKAILRHCEESTCQLIETLAANLARLVLDFLDLAGPAL